MRKFIIALAASAVLFMSPASAEFTDAEKTESLKLIQSILILNTGIYRAGLDISSLGSTQRQPLKNVLKSLITANQTCTGSWRTLSGTLKSGSVENRAENVRADDIASATNIMSSCVVQMREVADEADLIVGSQIPSDTIRSTADVLATFDWSLGFLDPLPEDYPRIIGPHGIWDPAQARLRRTQQYLIHAAMDAANWYGGVEVYSDAANEHFTRLFKAYGEAFSTLIRAWSLGSAVVMPDDQLILEQDFAASTAFRPLSFFRLLLAVEYLHGSSGPPPQTFSGREVLVGFSQQIATFQVNMVRAFQVLAPINSETEIRRWMVGKAGSTGAGADGTGRFTAHMLDLVDFWGTFDKWANLGIGFFFDIIPPAPSGAVTCGAGTVLDSTTTPAQCVPVPAPPPPPPVDVIVCGAGTVLNETVTPHECTAVIPPPVVPLTVDLCTEVLVGGDCRRQVRVLVE